jgi:hypothetical protein
VFNHCPCENKFEEAFARFLDKADDVVRFSKLPERFEFVIEYMDCATNPRHYEPDFVVVTGDRMYWRERKNRDGDANRLEAADSVPGAGRETPAEQWVLNVYLRGHQSIRA